MMNLSSRIYWKSLAKLKWAEEPDPDDADEDVTLKVGPDCGAFCKENGMELPELPSRDLIGLRAACARVANISGAAEQFEQIYRDDEDTTVMECDGSMGDFLSSLLNAHAIAVCS